MQMLLPSQLDLQVLYAATEKLPFAAASFDLVTSSNMPINVARYTTSIGEMWRMFRLGGITAQLNTAE